MTDRGARMRLDQALVERGMVASRARARDLILRGEVEVGGRAATKPAQMIAAADGVALKAGHFDHVSRGALKLRAALAHFGLEAAGRTALDVGASTGGFTEVLLAAGAARVYAVDNGRGQLHARLRHDPRVISLEGCDARRLDRSLVPDPVAAITADVSFISLTKVLPPVLALAEPGCWLVALVKPQFEAGPDLVPRDGVVKDAAVLGTIVANIEAWLAAQPGWKVLGCIASPIAGGDGNREFLIAALRED